MYSQLHGIVHQVCTGELSYPCLLFEWPKENPCNQAFTARSSGRACDIGGFEGVGFGCRLPTSTFLDHFRVAGRVFPSFNQPTCTASIETEPPSTPSTGNVSGSAGVRG